MPPRYRKKTHSSYPLVHSSKHMNLNEASLEQIWQHLDERIEHLSKRLEKHRAYGKNAFAISMSQKCSMVCQKLGENKEFQCRRECTDPRVRHIAPEELAEKYPIDAKLLIEDPQNLGRKEHFYRYQREPHNMELKPEEADMIAEIFGMPMAVEVFSPESWHHAMNVMKHKSHRPALKKLVENWILRYPKANKETLIGIIQRHDSPSNTIARTLKKTQDELKMIEEEQEEKNEQNT